MLQGCRNGVGEMSEYPRDIAGTSQWYCGEGACGKTGGRVGLAQPDKAFFGESRV